MVNNVTDYNQWTNLSEKEKYYIVDNIWLNNMKEGRGIRRAILNGFKDKYGKQKGIFDIKFRWYGLYNFDIFVTIKKGYKIRLPHKFDIFFVEKKHI